MIEYETAISICMCLMIGFMAIGLAAKGMDGILTGCIILTIISGLCYGSMYLIYTYCPKQEVVTTVQLTSVDGCYVSYTGEYGRPTVYAKTGDVYEIKKVTGAVVNNTEGEAYLETKKTFSKFLFVKVGTTETIIHVPK